MNVEQHARAQSIARSAVGLVDEEGEAYLRQAADGDAELLAAARRELALVREVSDNIPTSKLLGVPTDSEPDGEFPARAAGRRYDLVEKLGAGGMGVVYRAIDQRLDRPVALKHLRHSQADRPRAQRRLEREAKAAAKLSHPAIVQIFDILLDRRGHWIVMEFVPGRSLASLLAGGPLEPGTAVSLAAEIAGGLAAAHGQGIVHRDLKASNVMVTPEGHAKILDFGLAKPVTSDGDSLTRPGAILGTPKAMAPEQVMGRPADARTDLFSFGSLLYEMVTGKAPFQGDSPQAILQQVCRFRPLSAKDLNPCLPEELSELIEALTEKDPAHRPRETSAVAHALSRLAESVTHPAAIGAPGDRRPAGATSASTGSDGSRGSGERRQITVLSCQLLAARGGGEPIDDPEELLSIRPAFRQLSGRIIDRCGGHFGRQLDDGITAYFGFPAAHEGDSERAVLAALEIIGEIGRLNARLGRGPEARITLRIGVHSGQAVATWGENGSQQLFLGKTGSVAAAVKNLAAPESLVVSAEVHRSVESSFPCESLGAFQMSGWHEPVTVYRVLATGAARLRQVEAGVASSVPLVGRKAELELMVGRWRQAESGNGQVVLLSGEAGIGKTRLVQALRERLSTGAGSEPAVWLECACARDTRISSLFPIQHLLRQILGTEGEEEDQERHLTRLQEALRRCGLAQDEAVPLLADLLAVPLDAGHTLSAGGQRTKTLEALVMLLMEQAERRPVAVVVEDVHWADPSTLELLGLLAEQVPAVQLLLILTSHPGFRLPGMRGAASTQCALAPLAAAEVEELIDRLTGGPTLPSGVLGEIRSSTDGVPLFVEEMIKSFLETGRLVVRGDRYELVGSLPSSIIPSTLQSWLMARLDRLGNAKEVAQAASVLGREFSVELLSAVVSPERMDLESALDRLVKAELCRRVFRGTRYQFRHALVREKAYQSLLTERRGLYHRRAADALVDRFPETAESRPELVAHHYAAAGASLKAIGYWGAAGRRAFERSAFREATEHFRAGLELNRGLAAGTERGRRELALLIRLGPVLTATEGYRAAYSERTYQRIRDLCRRLGDGVECFWALRRLWSFRFVRGELAAAEELAAQLLRLAAEAAEPEFLLTAHYAAGNVSLGLGELLESCGHMARGAFIDMPERDLPLALMIAEKGAGGDAPATWLLGHPDRALEIVGQAVATAEGVSHPYGLAYALAVGTFVHQYCRDPEEVRSAAERTVDLCRDRIPFWEMHGGFMLGWAKSQGEGAEAGDGFAQMGAALDAFESAGAVFHRTYYLGLLAEAYAGRGLLDPAHARLRQAFEVLESSGERFWEAELHRLSGELALATRDADRRNADRRGASRRETEARAEESFQRARAVARDQAASSLELRAVMSLSRLWRTRGQTSAALELLAEVYGRFEDGFETPDLVEARALLAEFAEEGEG